MRLDSSLDESELRPMYTVKQVAEYLDISPTGLHRWVDRHKNELSPSASDSGGAGRQFTEDDVEILWTIKLMRDQNIIHEDIGVQLKKGYRIPPDYMPDDLPQPPAVPRNEISQLRAQIGSLNAEIDTLRDEVATKDKRISSLEGQVEILRQTLIDLYSKDSKE